MQLNPTIKSIDIGEFTGDRSKDIDKMMEILENDYGITEIPEGYVVHHDIGNGILQLVDENVHAQFTHIGGYSIYK
ncbi:MAG: HNH endonuclease [Lachnospiraceae bacterium]